MKSGIYKIKCIINNKFYVGSAVNFEQRWHNHRKMLNKGLHHNILLQRAWDKYGEDSFHFEIIETCQKSLLIDREQHYLDALNPNYNICPTAGSMLGFIHSEETKKKIGDASRGKNNFFYGQNIAARIRTGKHHSSESKQKISESKKGRASWNKGKLCPQLSVSQIGRKHSEETKRKIGLKSLGRHQAGRKKGERSEENIAVF